MILTCKACGADYESKRQKRDFCSSVCANRHTGAARANKPATGKIHTVWACGGGVQSTAIAVLIENGKLPKPDFGIMVDCGYEKTATHKYMREVTIPRMEAVGVRIAMADTLVYTNNDILDSKGRVNIPAFRVRPDGGVSKLHTRCNYTWKTRVARKWLREQGVSNCEYWMGISKDEDQRLKESPVKWIRYGYPLIDFDMTREDCLFEIARAGWPKPPRTSCIFCPQQDNKAWENMFRNCPEDWAVALEVERSIRAEAPDVYLHRSCKPLEKIFR
jgi:hypothetical protein